MTHLLRFLTSITVVFLLVQDASAQSIITSGIPGCDFASGQLTAACIPNFLAHVIQVVFGFTGAICILMIIVSGYEYILGTLPGGAGGSKESAVQRLTWAIVGFIVSALAFFIISFFISAIGG